MAEGSSSEWGKINQGQAYLPFTVDFARAVFAIGLGEHQASLFWYFVEHCWAPAKKGRTQGLYADPVGCTVELSKLAKLWDVPLPRLSAARKWLVDANMIQERDGMFWVNKEADTWLNPATKGPLLAPRKLAYAAEGRTRFKESDEQSSVTVDRKSDDTNKDASVTVNRKSDDTNKDASVTVNRNECMDSVTVDRNKLTVDRNLDGTHKQISVTVDRNNAHYIEPVRVKDLEYKDNTPLTPQGGESGEGFALASPDVGRAEKGRRRSPAAAPFVRPEWIPEDVWDAFVEMRRKARKPPTDYALSLIVRELISLRDAGHEPVAVLQQSIRNSWLDVFPLRETASRSGPAPAGKPKAERQSDYFDRTKHLQSLKEMARDDG